MRIRVRVGEALSISGSGGVSVSGQLLPDLEEEMPISRLGPVPCAPWAPERSPQLTFLLRGHISRYFGLYRPCGLWHSYSSLPSWSVSSCRPEPPSEDAGTPKPLSGLACRPGELALTGGGGWGPGLAIGPSRPPGPGQSIPVCQALNQPRGLIFVLENMVQITEPMNSTVPSSPLNFFP